MKINFYQIIEKFNQLDIKIRYAIFGSILLIIFLLDFFTVMSFQSGNLKKISTENQTLKQDIQHLKADLARIDQIKVGLQDSRNQLEAMNMKIRPVGEVSFIQEEINRIGSLEKIKIDQLTPQFVAQQALISKGPVKYYALPIVIQATSGYHMFGHFLNQLESAQLFFTMSDLTLEARANDTRQHGINATFKVILSDKNTDPVKDPLKK